MRSANPRRRGSARAGAAGLSFALAALGLVALLTLPSAAAATKDVTKDVTWSVTIDSRQTGEINRNAPLVLRPEGSPHLVIDLANHGSREAVVRAVRVDGRVIGLSFFSYTTRIDVALPPGTATRREVDLDLDELGSQAVGLIPARAQLVSADRTVLDQESFPVDVKGSALSVYAVFGLSVAGITLVLLASLLILIARRQLPGNRWKRAVLFLPVGAGLGMTVTFTLSATRLLTPDGPSWLALVCGCAGVAFILGYFLPLGFVPSTADITGGDRASGLGGATS